MRRIVGIMVLYIAMAFRLGCERETPDGDLSDVSEVREKADFCIEGMSS